MMEKKLKIIGVPWHVGHQYELARMSFVEEYDLLVNPYRTWGEKSRPFPEKMKWVDHYEPGKYDFALLHIDQQCIKDRIGKGNLYREVNSLIKDIPKIVINHMVPLDDDFSEDEVISRVKALVGNNIMIVNTYEAQKQWGWGNPIIHGMFVDEWESKCKEPRITTYVSSGGMEKAYKRELLRNVIHLLNEWGYKFYWIGEDVKFSGWNDYRNWLSHSLVYLNLTYQSPRPRSRTEAMLSGCCVVTNRHQDADSFIEDGVNGFLVGEDPVEIATLVSRLITTDCDKALEVGKRGREYARKVFSHENFERQWRDLLTKEGLL